MEANPVAYINTLLRYYLNHPDPDALTNEQWAECFAQLQDIRQKELKK